MPRNKNTADAQQSLNVLTAPSQLRRALNMALYMSTAAIVLGGPGIGKTELGNAVVRESRFADPNGGDALLPCVPLDWRMVSKQAEDMTGLPLLDPVARTTERTLPALIATARRLAYQDAKKPAKQTHIPVVVFDEFNTGSDRAAFQALMEVALDRRLDAYDLPPGTRVLMFGNTPEHGVDVMDAPLPLIDRAFVFTYDPFTTPESAEEWATYADSKGCHSLITSAIRTDPTLLRDFDNNRDRNASPRGWLRDVSALLSNLERRHAAFAAKAGAKDPNPRDFTAQAVNDDMFMPLLAARVGDGPALRFMAIAKEYGRIHPVPLVLGHKGQPADVVKAYPRHTGDAQANVRNIMQAHLLIAGAVTTAHADRALAWIDAHMGSMMRTATEKLMQKGSLSAEALKHAVVIDKMTGKGGTMRAASEFDK